MSPKADLAQQPPRAGERVRRVLDRLDRSKVEAEAVRLGGILATRRAELGISQRDLAAQCGTTQSAIARLEAGHTPPRLSTLLRLADALECDLVIDIEPRPA